MSSGISSKPQQAGHGSQFVSFKTVFNNYFLPDVLTEFMDISEKEEEIYSIKKGDIFLTRTSETLDELGMSCVAVKDYSASSFSGFLKRLRPTQDDITYDKFMAFYLRSDLFRKTMTNNSIMTLRASLNEQIFSYLELILPDYKEQKKAGDFLYSINTKIELNNRINAELEAMAKTLYDYWFVQFDFPYVTSSGVEKPYKTSGGKMVWNEELKREIPEGWESGELKDLFNLNPTLSIKKGAVSSYIDMNALPTDGYMTKAVQEKEFSGGVKFQNGDIIVARITPCLENGKTGLITLLEEDEIGFGSTEFIVLRGKNMTLSCFGAFLSRSELFRKYAIANMLGTSGRKRVEASKIGSFPIAIPKEAILKKFEKVISAHFKQETINTKENQELASLRDWLLPMLMNGQVSVGDVAVLRQAQDDMLGMVAEASARYEK